MLPSAPSKLLFDTSRAPPISPLKSLVPSPSSLLFTSPPRLPLSVPSLHSLLSKPPSRSLLAAFFKSSQRSPMPPCELSLASSLMQPCELPQVELPFILNLSAACPKAVAPQVEVSLRLLSVEFTSHSLAAALPYSASKFEPRVKFISAELAARSAEVSSYRAWLSSFSVLVSPLVKFTAPSEF